MSTVAVEPISLYTIVFERDVEGTRHTLKNCIDITMSNNYLGYNILVKDDDYTPDFRVYNKFENRAHRKDVTVYSVERQEQGGLLIVRRT